MTFPVMIREINFSMPGAKKLEEGLHLAALGEPGTIEKRTREREKRTECWISKIARPKEGL